MPTEDERYHSERAQELENLLEIARSEIAASNLREASLRSRVDTLIAQNASDIRNCEQAINDAQNETRAEVQRRQEIERNLRLLKEALNYLEEDIQTRIDEDKATIGWLLQILVAIARYDGDNVITLKNLAATAVNDVVSE